MRAARLVRPTVAAALFAVAVLLAPPPAPAAAGTSAGELPVRTIAYDVRVRGRVLADPAQLARIAARTFNDRRGWSLGGSLRFVEVPAGGAFTLWLAAPEAMTTFSPVCSAQYSCQVGRDVVINDARWRTGTASWPAVREYRPYVLNHELGHWFGLGHSSCPRPGAPAPVMQQQSKGLGGCRSTTWPLEHERRAVGASARVPVRSTAPALHVVDRESADVHVVGGADGYASTLLLARSLLPRTAGEDWAFAVADHDQDGVDDLYAVAQQGASGRTEVHVLDGASGYRTWLLHASTALHVTTAADWTFAVGDLDGDGIHDLYGVNRRGARGTEVHVLDGAGGFQTWALHAATPLHRTAAGTWAFALGDHDRDGHADLHAVTRRGASGRTELHVLSGASGFGSWLLHEATLLGPSPRDDWSFTSDDADGDGHDDLVALARAGASGRTEVHVLGGGGTQWLVHAATPLPPTQGEQRWSLDAE